MMLIKPDIRWSLEHDQTTYIDLSLFQVLVAVRETGSLKASAVQTGLSYRHIWGLIKKWEGLFKHPLLVLERGRGKGARLTEFAEQFLRADETMQSRIHDPLSDITADINKSLSPYLRKDQHQALKLYASHGMAIHTLFDILREDPEIDLDYETHGSLESLKYLNSGHCQLAGFHLPLEQVNEVIAPQYQQWISTTKHTLLTVATREQGLIIKKGNPRQINTLNDICDHNLIYINRQRNSGTRTIFDQLLKEHNIDRKNINGYENEEFTHVAVAAMIASGAADAGFGIEAAAAQFDLGFIPFLKEAYVLAVSRDCDETTIEKIKIALQSRKYRMKVNKLPGYNASNSGKEISFETLLRQNTT